MSRRISVSRVFFSFLFFSLNKKIIVQADKQPVILMQASSEGTRAAFKGLGVLNSVTLNGADLVDALLHKGGENSSK